MAEQFRTPRSNVEMVVRWQLEHEVERTREALVNQARRLAERLTRLADGLEADPDFSFNTIGELQGNGVELDTMCVKLGYARRTLTEMKHAMEADEKEAAAE